MSSIQDKSGASRERIHIFLFDFHPVGGMKIAAFHPEIGKLKLRFEDPVIAAFVAEGKIQLATYLQRGTQS